MNSKGQSLVLFILTLPLIFIIFMLIIDLGNLSYTKKKYEEDIKSTIKYGLNNLDEENILDKMNKLLESNINAEKNIKIENNVIMISVKDKKLNLNYIGYKENDKLIIESR